MIDSPTFTPGPSPNTVRAADGRVLTIPDGWALLSPGDAALTRRVKEAGEHWLIQEKKGRKVFSRGVWAPAATIDLIRTDLDAERSTESFAKKKEADARRREKAQVKYVEDFHGAVVSFLAFHADYADLAERMARAGTDHATPVGSGTVAPTKRNPVEQRAEAAVIAWMRHVERQSRLSRESRWGTGSAARSNKRTANNRLVLDDLEAFFIRLNIERWGGSFGIYT